MPDKKAPKYCDKNRHMLNSFYMTDTVSVLFVCLGNICRSPTAEGVLKKISQQVANKKFIIDSAGTSSYHRGEAPDIRSQNTALKRGYDLSNQRSRPVELDDFYKFDYIFAMDESNLADLKEMDPGNGKAKISLLLNYSTKELKSKNVPDPYLQRETGFDTVLDLIEDACTHFLKQLEET